MESGWPTTPFSKEIASLRQVAYFQSPMTREMIQKALAQRPFRPFSVRLTDGRLVPIKGEDSAAVHPNGETMIVFEEGGYRIIDIPLITELQTA